VKGNGHHAANPQLSSRADHDRLLDVREAAVLLRLQPRTLYKLAYERRLPVVKVGRATRFRLSSLMRLITEWERPASRPLRPRDGV
jgi:excisionase family DNA binding protein